MLNLLCMMIYKKGDDTHVTWVMIHWQISLSMHEEYFSNLVWVSRVEQSIEAFIKFIAIQLHNRIMTFVTAQWEISQILIRI